MTRTLTTQLIGIAAAGLLLIGCGKSTSPLYPGAGTGVSDGNLALHGSVAGETSAGMVQLEGVSVSVSNGAVSASTATDANGDFQFTGLTADTWTINVTKDGYTDQALIVNLEGDTSLSFSLELQEPPLPVRKSRIR